MNVPRRELALLQCANLLGGVSNALVMVVIPWLILERTGSATAAGVAGALAGLPGIVLAPAIGAVVDRVGRRTVSVVSDLLSALSVVLFPLLDGAGLLGLGAIFALTLAGAAFDPAGYTARKALIPDVAQASGVARTTVNGLHEGIFLAGWVIGPVLGAALIASLGAVATMWAAAGAFVLASAAVVAMRVPDRAEAATDPAYVSVSGAETGSWRVGLRALLADRPVLVLTVAVAVVGFIYMPTESVLLPVHYQAQEQPEAFGTVLSALAAGCMVGAFGFGWLANRAGLHRITTVCLLLTGLAYVPISFLPGAVVMALAALLLGLAWGPLEPLLNTVVQERFPPEQHGRVYGIQLAAFYAAPPLGQLAAGVAVEAYGVQPVFVVIAVGLLAVGVLAAGMPSLRQLDETRERRAPA